MFDTKLIALLALAGVLFSGGVYLKGTSDGKESCHAAQEKKTTQIKRTHAKVKREAPGDSDKPAAISWLLARTRK